MTTSSTSTRSRPVTPREAAKAPATFGPGWRDPAPPAAESPAPGEGRRGGRGGPPPGRRRRRAAWPGRRCARRAVRRPRGTQTTAAHAGTWTLPASQRPRGPAVSGRPPYLRAWTASAMGPPKSAPAWMPVRRLRRRDRWPRRRWRRMGTAAAGPPAGRAARREDEVEERPAEGRERPRPSHFTRSPSPFISFGWGSPRIGGRWGPRRPAPRPAGASRRAGRDRPG